MRPLSNLPSTHDDGARGNGSTPHARRKPLHRAVPSRVDCRPAERGELDTALRLLLSNGSGPASDEQVLDFLAFSIRKGVNVHDLWIAVEQDRLAWVLLPILSPGRTMLLLGPGTLPASADPRAVGALAETVCTHFAGQDIHLAQVLLDGREPAIGQAYQSAGFTPLAELIYLERKLRGALPEPQLDEGLTLLNYSPQNHGLFADAIPRSYRDSLDCPGLNGLRDVDDIIAGHQGTGEFDPALWFVLLDHGQPAGVLLLTRTSQSDALELVYLGLAPQARGRGLGDLLLRLALACAAQAGATSLTLAVDSRNAPALKLYYRHGLRRIGARHALIRSLRSGHSA